MRLWLKLLYILPVVLAFGVFSYVMSKRSHVPLKHFITGEPFATTAITNLTARLFTSQGHLDPAGSDVFIEFRDDQNRLVDVGEVQFEMGLNSTDSILHTISKVLPTGTVGQYRMNVTAQVGGEWKATLSINGPRGKAESKFLLTVR